jgi:hypothetical protein
VTVEGDFALSEPLTPTLSRRERAWRLDVRVGNYSVAKRHKEGRQNGVTHSERSYRGLQREL